MNALLVLLLAVSAYGANYLPTVHPVVTVSRTEWVEIGTFRLSHFSCDPREGTAACIGQHTGTRPVEGRTVASRDLPAGTVLMIEGYGEHLVVEDFCGWCETGWLDVFIDDHDRAWDAGVKFREVWLQKVPE